MQPLNAKSLEETQRSYKEFVFRQGTLKHTLDEATQAIRNLTATLIERMGTISESTGSSRARSRATPSKSAAPTGLPRSAACWSGC
jgi:diguanylate cyclase